MTDKCYIKEKPGDENRFTTYTTLPLLLKTEGLLHMVESVRYVLRHQTKFEYDNIIIHLVPHYRGKNKHK